MSIRKHYAYHRPSPAGVEAIAKLRQKFSDLEDDLEKLSTGAELVEAKKFLRLSCMMAVAGVVMNDPNSAVDPDSWPKDHAAPADAPPVPTVAPEVAYNQGKAAVKSNIEAAHINPYPAGSVQATAWLSGYTDHRGY